MLERASRGQRARGEPRREDALEAERIWSLARSHAPRATEWRRHIHAHPELSFQEHETSAYVRGRLEDLGYRTESEVGGVHSVVATLEGATSRPTVALRADIDALPIAEATGLPFGSQNPGVMHACGHDAHAAILLGAAAALRDIRDELPANVVFLFQPAEELPPGGAQPMVEAGVLDRAQMVFALHQDPEVDAGEIAVLPGPRNASADSFAIRVLGRSAHAARPHRGVDAIAVAAQVVDALQHVVSRQVDPMQPAVVTIGTIRGGTKENIIASEVVLTGTLRTQSEALRAEIPRTMERVVEGVTRAHGASYAFDFKLGYPVLVNDERAAAIARRAAERILGKERVRDAEVAMYGEDFSYMVQRRSGAMISLGSGSPEAPRPRRGAHTEGFVLDERCIEVGIAWYVSTVLTAAEELSQG